VSRALLAVVVLLAAPAAAQARAGDVQRSFGTRGTQTLNVKQGDAVGGALDVLAGNRMLAGGAARGRFVVVRLHSGSGKLDNNFGDRGQFIPDLPGTSLNGVQALATFRDGRIVAAGTLDTAAGSRMAAVRLLANGDVDPSFGGGAGYVLAGPPGAQFGDMSMDTNGNIALAGARPGEVPLVVRLLPDGTPDTSFGAGGTVDGAALGLTGRATSVLARPDGTTVFSVGEVPGHTASSAFTVVRLLATGAPDPGFNATGISTVGLGTPVTGDGLGAGALNIGPGGTIIVAGTVASARGTQQALASRLRSNGALDKRFGTHGFARVARSGQNLRVTGLARDSAGRILIAGTARAPESLVARLRPSGRRDTHFGSHGVRLVALGRPGHASPVYTEFTGVDAVETHAVLVGLAAGPGQLVRAPTGTAYAGRFALTVSRLH
jgi:uncharacterized delta-60 repeat protein